MTSDFAEVAQVPAGEVDEMYALVEQLAAAGQGGVGPPFAVVADASAVSVSAAEEHQRADGPVPTPVPWPSAVPDESDG